MSGGKARTRRTPAAVALLAAVLAGCTNVPPATPGTGTPPPATATLASGTPSGAATPSESVSPSESATPTPAASSATTIPDDPLDGMVVPRAASGRPSTGGVTLAPFADGPLRGRTIVVDPGHNGTYVSSINTRPVPKGGGGTKACNESGTSAIDGTPEHEVNWAVGVRLVGLLRARGATVVLTRPDDQGVGPCVNERAAIANRNRADLLLSIHGDGNESSSARGFHVLVSSAMQGGSDLARRSTAVAKTLVTEVLDRTRLPRSNYAGGGTGVAPTAEMAGLNLLEETPGVILEMGNLRSSADWALLKSAATRDALAQALAATAEKVLA